MDTDSSFSPTTLRLDRQRMYQQQHYCHSFHRSVWELLFSRNLGSGLLMFFLVWWSAWRHMSVLRLVFLSPYLFSPTMAAWLCEQKKKIHAEQTDVHETTTLSGACSVRFHEKIHMLETSWSSWACLFSIFRAHIHTSEWRETGQNAAFFFSDSIEHDPTLKKNSRSDHIIDFHVSIDCRSFSRCLNSFQKGTDRSFRLCSCW